MSPATRMTGAPTPDWVLIAPALTLAAIGLFAATMFGIWAWRHRNTHARLRVLADEWDDTAAEYHRAAARWHQTGRHQVGHITTGRARQLEIAAVELRNRLDRVCLPSTATASPAASVGTSTSSTTSPPAAPARPARSATGPAPSPADAGDSKRR